MEREDRYEITVDVDEAGEMEYVSTPQSAGMRDPAFATPLNTNAITINLEYPHHQRSNVNSEASTQRLKSVVTRRKGRGFGSEPTGLPSITHFETLQEESSGRAMRSVEGWTLFLRGLHEECTEDDVADQCGEYGRVRDVRLNLDHRTGYVKGYALVEYETYAEAKTAVEALNGTTFMDCILECDFAFVKPPLLES